MRHISLFQCILYIIYLILNAICKCEVLDEKNIFDIYKFLDDLSEEEEERIRQNTPGTSGVSRPVTPAGQSAEKDTQDAARNLSDSSSEDAGLLPTSSAVIQASVQVHSIQAEQESSHQSSSTA